LVIGAPAQASVPVTVMVLAILGPQFVGVKLVMRIAF